MVFNPDKISLISEGPFISGLIDFSADSFSPYAANCSWILIPSSLRARIISGRFAGGAVRSLWLRFVCVCAGGGGGLSLLAPGIKLPINPLNPGLVFCILFTAALVNCCIISGFCRIISSIPGIDDLNIVFVIWTIIAEPPNWNNNFNSGAILALDLYFSCSSPKISSYSSIPSFTCSPHPSILISKGSNLLFKNSNPVIAAINIFPWNLQLFDLSFSAIIISYSPCISARDDSIEYFLVSLPPLRSISSNFLNTLNFSKRASSGDNLGRSDIFLSGLIGTLLNLVNPSHVLLFVSEEEAVAFPTLDTLTILPMDTLSFCFSSASSSIGEVFNLMPPPPPPPPKMDVLNSPDFDIAGALLGSSAKSFNSCSKLFKSPKPISAFDDFFPLFICLSFISNSSPPPKLTDGLEEEEEESFISIVGIVSKFNSIISFVTSTIIVYYI